MTLLDHLIVAFLAIAYPIWVGIDYSRMRDDLVAGAPGARVRAYRKTVIELWVMGIAVLVLWLARGRSLEALGLGVPRGWPGWVGLVVALATTAFLFQQLAALARDAEKRRVLAAQLADAPATEFLPRSEHEARWFDLVSLSAALNEEVIYRGFLIWYLGAYVPVWLAVVLAAVVFALGHVYQGWPGMLRPGFIGLALGVFFVLTGSLWGAIVLHFAVDAYSGRLGRLVEEPTHDPGMVR